MGKTSGSILGTTKRKHKKDTSISSSELPQPVLRGITFINPTTEQKLLSFALLYCE
jgi:hypothetical protein